MGKDNKAPAFLKKSPLGKVPVLETAQGCLCEAAAIARCDALQLPPKRTKGGRSMPRQLRSAAQPWLSRPPCPPGRRLFRSADYP